MNKDKIAEKIMGKLDISFSDSKVIMDKFVSSFKDSLLNDKRIEIRGFGVFKIIEKKKSIRRNPRTGEKVVVLPKKVVVFKPGEELKEIVNY